MVLIVVLLSDHPREWCIQRACCLIRHFSHLPFFITASRIGDVARFVPPAARSREAESPILICRPVYCGCRAEQTQNCHSTPAVQVSSQCDQSPSRRTFHCWLIVCVISIRNNSFSISRAPERSRGVSCLKEQLINWLILDNIDWSEGYAGWWRHLWWSWAGVICQSILLACFFLGFTMSPNSPCELEGDVCTSIDKGREVDKGSPH
jgi:hypothetical protein